jgi:cysteinyl-tRNA synthetase
MPSYLYPEPSPAQLPPAELRGHALWPIFARPIQVDAAQADTARKLFEQAEPEAVRYFTLTEHPKTPLTLVCTTGEDGVVRLPQLDSATDRVAYLYASRRRIASLPRERIVDVERKPPVEISGIATRLREALAADLHTPLALSELTRFLAAVNELCDAALRKKGSLARSHQNDALAGFDTVGKQLALGGESPSVFLARLRDRRAKARGISRALVERKIHERKVARESRDFAGADAVRAQLTAIGVELLDGPDGSTDWTVL